MNVKYRAVSILLSITALSFTGADWTRFRGPNGSGIAQADNPPAKWSDKENISWKTRLPGPGSSSPITIGDRVFVTSYSGYGFGPDLRPGGDPKDLKRHLVCLDRASGAILWEKSVKAKLPEAPFAQPGLFQHGYASSTPATDGDRVYAFYGKTGVFAYDFDGNQLWHADVGSQLDDRRFGSGASPILSGNLLIVNAAIEGNAVVALDKRNGRQVWKWSIEEESDRSDHGSWSTPILVKSTQGQTDLVVPIAERVWGLNPETGKLRWHAVTKQERICSSLVSHGGIAYAIGAGPAAAIRVGGTGDVSKTHVMWTAKAHSDVPSPVYHDGHLFWSNDEGVVHCVNAANGEIVYQKRLPGVRQLFASPVLAAGKLYVVARVAGTFVLAARPEFQQIAHNKLTAELDIFDASPAVSDGKLLLRSYKYLYCIGAK
jgi:hypothetical protein